MGRVTLKDIARAVGVSVATVSLALRGSERISEPVRQRVLEEAAAQGYRSDLAGVLLRTSNPTIMGVVCDMGQELHLEYSRMITSRAEDLGWLVMTEDTASNGAAAAIHRLMQLRVQSLIVIDPSSMGVEPLREVNVPIITIGQMATAPKADLIRSNNTSGMRELARHLGDLGHIVCLDGGESYSATRRREDLIEAMDAAGVDVQVVRSGPTMEAGWRSMNKLLEEWQTPQEAPRAAVCYNDQCALGALMALTQSGWNVPEDLAVVGFDNSRLARSEIFTMTSIDRNPQKVAALAVERAIARAQGDDGPSQCLDVDTRLVVRSTS